MKTVWIVGVSDCESNSVLYICSNKALAEKKLFEERDKLVKGWAEYKEKYNKTDEMYQRMIKGLKGDNYEKWGNYPHDCPYIYEQEVLEE
jgi:hypothetical protein